jgi:uncharacterized protein YjiS (DUF1127 family)
MSGHVAKEEIALLMPERLTHYFQDDPEYLPASTESGRGLFATITSVLNWVIEIPRRRAVLDELGSLSDHELSDIGLSRSELSQVFDRHFMVERNVERDLMSAGRPVSM